MSEDFGQQPQRMALVNLVTGDEREPQYNPEKLEETIGASFAQLKVLGLSHAVQHFSNTENGQFSFSFFESAVGGDAKAVARLRQDRNWFKSLVHPHRSNSIERGGSPRVLFVWPGLLELTCFVKSLKFEYTQFNANAEPIRWTCSVQIDEVRDVFVSMDDILNLGDLRGASTGPTTVDMGEV